MLQKARRSFIVSKQLFITFEDTGTANAHPSNMSGLELPAVEACVAAITSALKKGYTITQEHASRCAGRVLP